MSSRQYHFSEEVTWGLIVSTSCSIAGCVAVIFTYIRWRRLRRHPASLVVIRSLCDLLFCIQMLGNHLYHRNEGGSSSSESLDDITDCKEFSFISEFLTMAAELFGLALSIDLAVSLHNPFTNFKANLRLYHALAWSIAAALATLVIVVTEDGKPIYAKDQYLDICWIKRVGAGTAEVDTYFLALFVFPVVAIYTLCILLLIVAQRRLTSGLPETFEARLQVFRSSMRFVLSYILYWLTAGAVYGILALVADNQPSETLELVLAFALGSRGVVTFGVWILTYGQQVTCTRWGLSIAGETTSSRAPVRSPKKLNRAQTIGAGGMGSPGYDQSNSSGGGGNNTTVPAFGTSSTVAASVAGIISRDIGFWDEDDADLRPHLNHALRKEMLYYATLGIVKCVIRSERDPVTDAVKSRLGGGVVAYNRIKLSRQYEERGLFALEKQKLEVTREKSSLGLNSKGSSRMSLGGFNASRSGGQSLKQPLLGAEEHSAAYNSSSRSSSPVLQSSAGPSTQHANRKSSSWSPKNATRVDSTVDLAALQCAGVALHTVSSTNSLVDADHLAGRETGVTSTIASASPSFNHDPKRKLQAQLRMNVEKQLVVAGIAAPSPQLRGQAGGAAAAAGTGLGLSMANLQHANGEEAGHQGGTDARASSSSFDQQQPRGILGFLASMRNAVTASAGGSQTDLEGQGGHYAPLPSAGISAVSPKQSPQSKERVEDLRRASGSQGSMTLSPPAIRGSSPLLRGISDASNASIGLDVGISPTSATSSVPQGALKASSSGLDLTEAISSGQDASRATAAPFSALMSPIPGDVMKGSINSPQWAPLPPSSSQPSSSSSQAEPTPSSSSSSATAPRGSHRRGNRDTSVSQQPSSSSSAADRTPKMKKQQSAAYRSALGAFESARSQGRRSGSATGSGLVSALFGRSDAERMGEFEFLDFEPHLFLRMRELNGIQTSDYIRSLSRTRRERFSEGASGAFLYYSSCDRFIVKTMTRRESDVLLRMLPDYVTYMEKHPHSLIARFYGCHAISMYGTQIFLVVMQNALQSHGATIHERYDLKGSWVNRHSVPLEHGHTTECRHCGDRYKVGRKAALNQCPARPNHEHEPNQTLRDADWGHKLRLSGETAQALGDMIVRDTEFLRRHNIMDYSLLLGIHRNKYKLVDTTGSSPATAAPPAPASRPAAFPPVQPRVQFGAGGAPIATSAGATSNSLHGYGSAPAAARATGSRVVPAPESIQLQRMQSDQSSSTTGYGAQNRGYGGTDPMSSSSDEGAEHTPEGMILHALPQKTPLMTSSSAMLQYTGAHSVGIPSPSQLSLSGGRHHQQHPHTVYDSGTITPQSTNSSPPFAHLPGPSMTAPPSSIAPASVGPLPNTAYAFSVAIQPAAGALPPVQVPYTAAALSDSRVADTSGTAASAGSRRGLGLHVIATRLVSSRALGNAEMSIVGYGEDTPASSASAHTVDGLTPTIINSSRNALGAGAAADGTGSPLSEHPSSVGAPAGVYMQVDNGSEAGSATPTPVASMPGSPFPAHMPQIPPQAHPALPSQAPTVTDPTRPQGVPHASPPLMRGPSFAEDRTARYDNDDDGDGDGQDTTGQPRNSPSPSPSADGSIQGYHNPQQHQLHASIQLKVDHRTGGVVPFFASHRGGLRAVIVEGPGLYYMGIIDILQEYTWSKWLEHWFKTRFMCKAPLGISAVPPDAYANRFRQRVIAQLIEGYQGPGFDEEEQQEEGEDAYGGDGYQYQ